MGFGEGIPLMAPPTVAVRFPSPVPQRWQQAPPWPSTEVGAAMSFSPLPRVRTSAGLGLCEGRPSSASTLPAAISWLLESKRPRVRARR